jgi:hypothetical protein
VSLFDRITKIRPNPIGPRDLDCDADLQSLWDCLMLGRPVVVLSPTPAFASRFVLDLARLVQGFAAPPILPYIPVTDPRIPAIVRQPQGIIGVSNPLAATLFPPTVRIVRSGFRVNCWLPFQRSASARRYLALFTNTERLASAVEAALRAMAVREPHRFSKGEMDILLLRQSLLEKGVRTGVSRAEFTRQLVWTQTFQEQYRRYRRLFGRQRRIAFRLRQVCRGRCHERAAAPGLRSRPWLCGRAGLRGGLSVRVCCPAPEG